MESAYAACPGRVVVPHARRYGIPG